ncbi:hypothetical protein ACF0H5_015741 [Mactra antiquata]
MKLILLLCLVAGSRANFLDTIGNALGGAANTVGNGIVDAANTVGNGVVDAANTVGNGIVDAANTVAGALPDVGQALGSTFGDVWNVVKDPLEEAGKELLMDAAKFALEQGVTMALDALAAGKREIADRDEIKKHMSLAIMDEAKKWMEDTKQQILGSKDELMQSMSRLQFNELPQELKTYVSEYSNAKIAGKTNNFVVNQARTAYANAVISLKQRLNQRIQHIISSLSAGV